MKILVAVKRVIDYQAKIHVKEDGSGVETSNIKMSMNPFDEIALEEALRCKEKGLADSISIVTVGEAASEETLRQGLAMGADEAIHVQTNTPLTPLNIAKALSAIVKREKVDLVLLGKQAIDDDCNQVGQMLAGLLRWPQAMFASKLTIEGDRATVVREVDGGLETIAVNLPAVVSADLRLNEPRYIKLPNIMKAKSKPISHLTLTELGVECRDSLRVSNVSAPEARAAGIRVNSIQEVMQKLKDDDRVLP